MGDFLGLWGKKMVNIHTCKWSLVLTMAVAMLAGCSSQPMEKPSNAMPVDANSTPQPTLPPSTPGKTIVADGELVSPYPSLTLPFGGGASGRVLTFTVKAGDVVQSGDLLAMLDDTELQRAVDDAQVDLDRAAANQEQTIAQADVNVRLAQLDLADARDGASDAELAAAQSAVRDARIELEVAQHAYSSTLNSGYDAAVRARKIEFDWYVGYYQGRIAEYEENHLSQSDHDHAMNAMISAEGQLNEAIDKAHIEEIQAENRVDRARSTLYRTWKELELLQSSPLTDTLLRAELAMDQALLDRERARADLVEAERLAQAQEALEQIRLVAPWTAIVLSVNIAPEANVGAGTPVVTLLNIEDGLRFVTQNLSEQHIADIYPGQRAAVTLRAFAGTPLEGTVEAVVPQVGGIAGMDARFAVHVRLEPTALRLLPGLTGRVEIFTEE
ncbi:MAG: HlyD family efflux transporter periplasmic adaptor subunit [Chloroflexota bacterium]|nr:HlyD family efflux transporter periplasmic adaptor subunit [Chloroflexota bacterium]